MAGLSWCRAAITVAAASSLCRSPRHSAVLALSFRRSPSSSASRRASPRVRRPCSVTCFYGRWSRRPHGRPAERPRDVHLDRGCACPGFLSRNRALICIYMWTQRAIVLPQGIGNASLKT
jgi:hypothetical protein